MSTQVDWIIKLLASRDPRDRDRGAEETSDASQALTEAQTMALAGAIIVLWLNETDRSAREAELSALAALVNQAAVPADVLAPVLEEKSSAQGSELDYFEEIDDIQRLRRS